jgi:D-arabinose 5-phosphate isomerase GutQ
MQNIHLDLIDACINKEISGLNGLFQVVRTEEYKQIINHLSNFRDYSARIIVAGVGKNSFIAEKAVASMASLGIPAMSLNISHCSHGDYGAIGPRDTVIHISRSGKTAEMVEAINYISNIRPHVVQILIHCNSNKPKSEANYELWCGDVQEGDKYSLAPTSTTTTLLCLLDTIAVELSHRAGFTSLDFFKYHPGGSLGASFTKVGFIYKTTNLVNGKFFVGKSTCDPREKFFGNNSFLINDIKQYGEENFRREILEYASQEELDNLERIWIDLLKADTVLGYNGCY